MKYVFLLRVILPVIGAVLLESGCVSQSNVTRSALPTAWKTALEKPATSATAFSGIYKNYGVSTHSSPGDISARNSLATFFALPPVGVAPPGSTIELNVGGAGKINIILRNGSQVVAQTECSFDWDAGNQALVVENSVKPVAKNSDHVSGAGIGWKTIRLMKGSDGAVYLQSKIRGVVAAFFVIPLGGTEESWGRWEPAPAPAGSAR